MRHFKNTKNEIYGFDENDESQHHLIEAAVADGWLEVQWPPAPTLAEVQAEKCAALKATYVAACKQDIAYTSAGNTAQSFQSDTQSVTNLHSMLIAYGGTKVVPAEFYCLAADNTKVPFTYADMQGLALVIETRNELEFQKFQALKSRVRTATSAAAVQDISW